MWSRGVVWKTCRPVTAKITGSNPVATAILVGGGVKVSSPAQKIAHRADFFIDIIFKFANLENRRENLFLYSFFDNRKSEKEEGKNGNKTRY